MSGEGEEPKDYTFLNSDARSKMGAETVVVNQQDSSFDDEDDGDEYNPIRYHLSLKPVSSLILQADSTKSLTSPRDVTIPPTDLAVVSETLPITVRSRDEFRQIDTTPRFIELKKQTNLNIRPSNWLRHDMRISSSSDVAFDRNDEYSMSNRLTASAQAGPLVAYGAGQGPACAALSTDNESLAGSLLDVFGDDAEFVSTAENMKKVLKIPYTNAKVSLAIHRVGNTLVLDSLLNDTVEFDEVEKPTSRNFLMARRQAYKSDSEAQKIHRRYSRKPASGSHFNGAALPTTSSLSHGVQHNQETAAVAPDEEKLLHVTPSNNDLAFSPKFQSGEQHEGELDPETGEIFVTVRDKPIKKKNKREEQRKDLFSKFLYHTVSSADASETSDAHRSVAEMNTERAFEPDSSPFRHFRRVVHWQLDDRKMILGSDTVIFRQRDGTNVSLALRESSQEFTALSCLDLWLENVMCSVSHTAVCFHKEGYVQGYQILPTHAIPFVSGKGSTPAFQPRAVLSNAAAVLQFLYSNCKEDAATYWLMKSKDSHDIQLFKVTGAAPASRKSSTAFRQGTPFDGIVAKLCYRIADHIFQTLFEREATATYASKPIFCGEDLLRCRNLFQKSLALLDPSTDEKGFRSLSLTIKLRLASTYVLPHEFPFCNLPLPAFSADDISGILEAMTTSANVQSAPSPPPPPLDDESVLKENFEAALGYCLNGLQDILCNEPEGVGGDDGIVFELRRLSVISLLVIARFAQSSLRFGMSLRCLLLASQVYVEDVDQPGSKGKLVSQFQNLKREVVLSTGYCFAGMAQWMTTQETLQSNQQDFQSSVEELCETCSFSSSGDTDRAKWPQPVPQWMSNAAHITHLSPDPELNWNHAIKMLMYAIEMEPSPQVSAATAGADISKPELSAKQSGSIVMHTTPTSIIPNGKAQSQPRLSKRSNALVDLAEPLSVLRAAYLSLGAHYARTMRNTKCAQHCKQGLQLFKSLHDGLAQALLQSQLAVITLKIATSSQQDVAARFRKALSLLEEGWTCVLERVRCHKPDEVLPGEGVCDALTIDEKAAHCIQNLLVSTHHKFADLLSRQSGSTTGKGFDACTELKAALKVAEDSYRCKLVGDCHYQLALFYGRRTSQRQYRTLAAKHFQKAIGCFDKGSEYLDALLTRIDLIKLMSQTNASEAAREEELWQTLRVMMELEMLPEREIGVSHAQDDETMKHQALLTLLVGLLLTMLLSLIRAVNARGTAKEEKQLMGLKGMYRLALLNRQTNGNIFHLWQNLRASYSHLNDNAAIVGDKQNNEKP